MMRLFKVQTQLKNVFRSTLAHSIIYEEFLACHKRNSLPRKMYQRKRFLRETKSSFNTLQNYLLTPK